MRQRSLAVALVAAWLALVIACGGGGSTPRAPKPEEPTASSFVWTDPGVKGEPVAPGVLTAVDAVNLRGFDEIIVSTLPTKVSRWLGMDAPARIERKTSVPVVHVAAEMAHH